MQRSVAPVRTMSSAGILRAQPAQPFYQSSKASYSQLFLHKTRFTSICQQSPVSCGDRMLRSEMLDSAGIRTQYLWRSAFKARDYDDLVLEDVAAFQNECSPCSKVDSQSSTLLDAFGSCSLVVDDLQNNGVPLSRIAFFKLSMADLSKVLRSILEGLQDLHSRGLSHGALTPDNVYVYISQSGEVYAKLANFGAAHSQISLFYAPEIIKAPRAKSYRADMYSFGKLVQFIYQNKVPASLRPLCAALSSVDPSARPAAHEVLTSMREHSHTLCVSEFARISECSYFQSEIEFPAEERELAKRQRALYATKRLYVAQENDTADFAIDKEISLQNYQPTGEIDAHAKTRQYLLGRIDDEPLRAAIAREFDFLIKAWQRRAACK